jgi:hypothetical protein
MSKKAPWVLALLAGASWSLAAPSAAQPILVVDGPQPGQTVAGVVAVTGFVLSHNSIDKIELFIDDIDVPANRAVLNLSRPDVTAAFPSFAGSPNSGAGWITSFLARNYPSGPHELRLKVTEGGVGSTTFGPITVNVDNTINQAPFGNIDLPAAGAAASGSLAVLGWALDDSDIDHLDFLADGTIWASAIGRGGVGNASFGGTRPDVFAAFPDFPGTSFPDPKSLYSGFVANLDTTQLSDGLHTISVRATDNQGSAREIGSVQIQVMNNGSLLGPFGQLEYPLDEATLICGPAVQVVPPGGPCPSPCLPGGGGGGTIPLTFFPNIVRGWALDTGARLDLGQVSYVELMLDGALLANTRSDCTVAGTILDNCYGLNRPDIEQQHQGYVNAANSGFQFAFGIAGDPILGIFDIFTPTPLGAALVGFTVPGKHTLSVRVGDEEETVTEWGAISVNITCDPTSSNPDRASFGNIDAPTTMASGTTEVLGWAFDLDGGVTSVDVVIDGSTVANLTAAAGTYGLRRDDVVASDVRVTTPFVGFAYGLDTTTLGDSEHDLTIYAWDHAAHRTLIGRRKVVVFNNTSAKQ